MANRYWVGGTGTWTNSSTANWSTTSGGASGASAPTSSDAVIFDSNSGVGTCTFGSGNCSNCSILSGTSITFGPGDVGVYGNWLNTAGVNMASGSAVYMKSSTSASITANSGHFSQLWIDSAGATFNLGSNLTCDDYVRIKAGILAPDTYTVYADNFVVIATSSAGISFTGSTPAISITGQNKTVINYDASNVTLTGNVRFALTAAATTGTRIIQATAASNGSNAISVQVDAGSDTVSLTGGAPTRLKTFTTTTGSFSGTVNQSVALELFGSLGVAANNTWINALGNSTLTFKGTAGGLTINTNGVYLGTTPIYFDYAGGNYQLTSSLYTDRSLILVGGTLYLAGYSVNCAAFSSTGTTTRYLSASTSIINLSGSGTVWDVSGLNITISAYQSSIFTSSSAAPKTFSTISTVSYGEVANTGASSLTLSPCTYYTVGAYGSGLGQTIYFTSGATTYIYVNLISGLGSGVDSITYRSTVTSTQATLYKNSPGNINLSYANIQDLSVGSSVGIAWNALLTNGNTNLGNNTGWNFGSTGTGNFMGFF